MALKLSEHFSLEEFTRSATAAKRGIDNVPTINIIWNICALIALVLEPLRQELGQPVVISSGYRCPELNTAVCGVTNSFHMSGRAADLRVTSNAYGQQVFDILKDNPFVDKVLYEHSSTSKWIHVQIAISPRNYSNPNYIA